MKTYYDTLQISRLANASVIKAAYRALSQKYHPDKNPGSAVQSNMNMQRLNEAYEVLSSETRRAAYDMAIAVRESEIRQQEESTDVDQSESLRPTQSKDRTADGWRNQSPIYEGTAQSAREKQELKSRFEKRRTEEVHVPEAPERTPATPEGGWFRFAFIWLVGLSPLLLIVWYHWFR